MFDKEYVNLLLVPQPTIFLPSFESLYIETCRGLIEKKKSGSVASARPISRILCSPRGRFEANSSFCFEADVIEYPETSVSRFSLSFLTKGKSKSR